MRCRVFKQLAEHPIARDPRITTHWDYGQAGSGVRWWATLTGNPKVRLNWLDHPAELANSKSEVRVEPRCPTALCMNVLFRLLAKAQVENPVRFKHSGSMVYFFTQEVGVFYTKAVRDALRLWQQLSIEWPKLVMPPPIKEVKQSGFKIAITIHPKWLTACAQDKSVEVDLVLPMYATAQNLILYTLYLGSKENVDLNDFFYRISGNKRGTKTVPHVPLETWILAQRWYKKHGGYVDWVRLPYERKPNKLGRIRLTPSRTMHISVVRPTKRGRAWADEQKVKAWQRRKMAEPMANSMAT